MTIDNPKSAIRAHVARSALASASKIALAAASLLAGVALVSGTTAVAATPQDPPAAGAQDQSTVQDIIVTAQKREEPLQQVPVAVDVVQGAKLQNVNVNSLSDLAQALPSFHVVITGIDNLITLRGIGSGAANPAFDQSVAMFEDDIYHGRAHMVAATFLDVDDVEVLKGPQSTFFGNNAIAGALNVTSKKPTDDFEGWARALYGSYGTYAVEGAVGGPINDKLSFRITGTVNGDAGWIHNVDTGGLAPAEQNIGGRLSFLFKPTSDFDALLKIEGSGNKITGSATELPFQWTNCPPPAPLKSTTVNKYCANAIAAGDPLGFGNNLNAGLPGQFADITTNDDVLTMNYHRWGLTFTSVTGYSAYHYLAHADNAYVGTYLATVSDPEHYNQWSQEFRITSAADQPLEYMVGAYYQSDHLQEILDGNNPALDATVAHLFPALVPYDPLAYETGFVQHEAIESVFGSATWNATSNLKFNAGLRYTSDQKNFVGQLTYGTGTQTYGGFVPYPAALEALPALILGVPGTYPHARTDDALMPSAGVQYQVAPEAMLYFSYSHGFKAGGFNGVDTSDQTGQGTAYGPEGVDAYEVGLKSKWFSNRLLVNLDGFLMNYTGLQVDGHFYVAATNSYDLEIRNAASAISQGVELESEFVATDDLHLSADVTYLDAHYVSYPNATANFLQTQNGIKSQDLSGMPLDFANKWSATLTGQYTVHLSDGYKLIATVSPYLASSYYNSNGTDDPLTLIPAHIRLDAQLTLDSGHNWAVDLIGKNLTNAIIIVSQQNTFNAKEEPLNVSVQARYKW